MKKISFVLSLVLFSSYVMADSGESLFSKCKSCHGADGSKNALGVSKPLKGQSKEDILKKLQGYKDGSYGGARKSIMKGQVSGLSEDDMKALAEYVAKF